MKIYTPVDAARKAGNKYLGVLVAAKFARYLNEFPRDHLDTGSVASPNRETEAMQDGSDAVSDWPLLNALLNTAGGATWVSLHHGGGVGMGFSQHAGVVIVCDGSDAAASAWKAVRSAIVRESAVTTSSGPGSPICANPHRPRASTIMPRRRDSCST